jgi:tRNA threonylcarbamoyladenosine biosynthesis protein TsaB
MPLTNAPKILAFDTSAARGSIALLEGPQLQAELKLQRLQNHSANLLRCIRFLLEGLNWKLEDLDLVACGIGPGSFTGIRIGIATGLGISQSLHIPFVGISGLEAHGCQAASLEGCVGVLLNAHRDQVYYAEYLYAAGRMRIARKPSLEFISDLPGLFGKRRMYLIGDTHLCPEEIFKKSGNSWPRIAATDPYLGSAIGRRALSVKKRWKSGNFLQCEPLYIRPPDAIRNRSGRR